MTEIEKLPPDSVAVVEIAALSPRDRVEKAREAHKMHVEGKSAAAIGEVMGLNEQTVVRLIDEELYRANTHRPHPQHLARARMQHIQEVAWGVLEGLQTGALNARSQNVPQLLRAIMDAQDKIDKYDGNEKPKRSETVQINLAELVKEAERQQRANRGDLVIEGEVVE